MSKTPATNHDDEVNAVAESILAGGIRAAARAMSWIDDGDARAEALLSRIHPHTGHAHIVGITGIPGAGKSTLTDQLVATWRERGERVAVVAVDPSSPFSGGAVLGDRLRMQRHATDPDVFIRSVATRGHLGGISRSTSGIVHVLDAMKFSRIIIETVGVGQDEVDIVRSADTTVVLMVPGLGDEIQALKAGIIEIADIFCVNKSDRPDTDALVRQLQGALGLRSPEAPVVPIVKTVARAATGASELVDHIEAHGRSAHDADARRIQRARAEISALVEAAFESRLNRALDARAAILKSVSERSVAPTDVAALIIDELLG